MNLPENDQDWFAVHVREALLRGSLNEQEHVSGSYVQFAVHRAVSRLRSARYESVQLAREAAEGAVLSAVGVAGEPRTFFGATVVGVVEATGQLLNSLLEVPVPRIEAMAVPAI